MFYTNQFCNVMKLRWYGFWCQCINHLSLHVSLYLASPFLQRVARTALPRLHRSYDPLRLPYVHLRFVRFSLSLPDTLLCLSLILCLFSDSTLEAQTSSKCREFCLSWPDFLLPLFIYPQGLRMALSSSRITPLNTCPALRPRWRLWHLPYRAKTCCLPHRWTASAFTPVYLELIQCPQLKPISGLNHTACILTPVRLRTPVTGFALGLRYWSVG